MKLNSHLAPCIVHFVLIARNIRSYTHLEKSSSKIVTSGVTITQSISLLEVLLNSLLSIPMVGLLSRYKLEVIVVTFSLLSKPL
jgi:hypothetical protein